MSGDSPFGCILSRAILISAVVTLLGVSVCFGKSVGGHVTLNLAQISNGSNTDITGTWLYKPGYAISKGEQPQDPSSSATGYGSVPVPQMLSRIRWWLDDSEGFKAFEERRLKALGFDTDKAEDGWYRLWIDLKDSPAKGRAVFVSFDGVAMKCRAYVNGHALGEHAGMFSRFAFDLAPYLRKGSNLLAVYVSMEKLDPSQVSLGEAVTVNLTMSKVVSMDKGMFGPLSPVADNRAYDLHGIWQPVSISVEGGARIEDAWFVPTLDSAKVHVAASGRTKGATVTATWADAATGKVLAKTTPVKVVSGRATLSAAGLKPKLWTPQIPNLYKMDVLLKDAKGHVLDSYSHKVGFRTFEARGNQLYLNGQRYWLRGANQLPYGKNPWDPALARKLVKFAHDGNMMLTRTHCTPWNEAWLDAADEIGLGVSIEGMRPWALVGKVPPPPADMVEHWKMENADVIRRCRNHPSVLIWTVGNEMTLRDDANLDKWKILSDMVKQTRSLDPTRPIVCSSAYYRHKDFYEEKLAPNGLDDGDLDDLHSYRGWYATSPFVEDSSWIGRACDYAGKRPIIGQEMATGYPNLDDGFPVTNYAERLMVPQAWVGIDADKGGNPASFLEHIAVVTKRLAEQLRFQRKDLTAGFMLFSSECWYKNAYDPATVAPYSVYDAVKMAFAPIGLALETPNKRFFAGDAVKTAVYVTNDDRDIAGPLTVEAEFSTGNVHAQAGTGTLDGSRYYETALVPLVVKTPSPAEREAATLRVSLLKDGREISYTQDKVDVFDKSWCEAPLAALGQRSVSVAGLGPNMCGLLATAAKGSVTEAASKSEPGQSRVFVVGASDGLSARELDAVKRFAERGGTALILNSGEKAQAMFPECIAKSRDLNGEFVETADSPAGLVAGLKRFDFKWWGRNDGRAFVVNASHNLVAASAAKPLARHIVVHGYIDESKKPDYVTSPLVEIAVGKGRVLLSEFAFEDSVSIDPAARRFAANLIAWAAGLPG